MLLRTGNNNNRVYAINWHFVPCDSWIPLNAARALCPRPFHRGSMEDSAIEIPPGSRLFQDCRRYAFIFSPLCMHVQRNFYSKASPGNFEGKSRNCSQSPMRTYWFISRHGQTYSPGIPVVILGSLYCFSFSPRFLRFIHFTFSKIINSVWSESSISNFRFEVLYSTRFLSLELAISPSDIFVINFLVCVPSYSI